MEFGGMCQWSPTTTCWPLFTSLEASELRGKQELDASDIELGLKKHKETKNPTVNSGQHLLSEALVISPRGQLRFAHGGVLLLGWLGHGWEATLRQYEFNV